MKKLYLFFLHISPFLLNAQSAEDNTVNYLCPKPSQAICHRLRTTPRIIQPNRNFVIRCVSAVNTKVATCDPLIVIDNYPFEGCLKDINLKPSQIKSITVLKDIDVSAIWCDRRSNGVIVIYTYKLDSIKLNKRQAKFKPIKPSTITSRKPKSATTTVARGKFSITLPNNPGPFNLRLINTQGQTLRTWKNSNSPGNLHEFDITGIPPGVYIACLQAGGRNTSEKILISQ